MSPHLEPSQLRCKLPQSSLRDASPLGDGAFGETGTFSPLSKGSLPEGAGEEQSDETEGVSKQKGLILSELYNILTEPIDPKEEIQIVLKRYLEHIVLFFYERDLARGRITKKNS